MNAAQARLNSDLFYTKEEVLARIMDEIQKASDKGKYTTNVNWEGDAFTRNNVVKMLLNRGFEVECIEGAPAKLNYYKITW